jgi:nucleoside-diphosphate-sugar epimerase
LSNFNQCSLFFIFFKRYVRENKLSQTASVREKVNQELKKINLIENNVVVNHEVLQASTASPETLHVIESQQYRERGLFHISDAAYAFFLLLEQERVDRINFSKLVDLQKNMIDDSIEKVLNNKSLFIHFKEIFYLETAIDKVRIKMLMHVPGANAWVSVYVWL